MDRDLGKPKKSKPGIRVFAGLTPLSAGLPMKQVSGACIQTRLPSPQLEAAASSKAHDKDGTPNKEIYR